MGVPAERRRAGEVRAATPRRRPTAAGGAGEASHSRPVRRARAAAEAAAAGDDAQRDVRARRRLQPLDVRRALRAREPARDRASCASSIRGDRVTRARPATRVPRAARRPRQPPGAQPPPKSTRSCAASRRRAAPISRRGDRARGRGCGGRRRTRAARHLPRRRHADRRPDAPGLRRARGRAQRCPAGAGSVTAVAIGADADLDDAERAGARRRRRRRCPTCPARRGRSGARRARRDLRQRAARRRRVELPDGLSEVAPTQLDTIPAGGESLVVARLTKPRVSRRRSCCAASVGERALRAALPGAHRAERPRTGNAFVPRLYAAARIADLERDGDAPTRKKRAVELSQPLQRREPLHLAARARERGDVQGLRPRQHAPHARVDAARRRAEGSPPTASSALGGFGAKGGKAHKGSEVPARTGLAAYQRQARNRGRPLDGFSSGGGGAGRAAAPAARPSKPATSDRLMSEADRQGRAPEDRLRLRGR